MKFIWQDIKYGLRSLLKKPVFFAVIVITLTLGIGINTAIFSVVNALLLSPLPYPNSEQIVVIWGKLPTHGLNKLEASGAEFADYRNRNHVFSHVAVYSSLGRNLTGVGEPERINVTFVTADFFGVLDTKPLYGRTFSAEEDQLDHNEVVILSYGLWQRRFGGDKNIIGQNISLDGRNHNVIGVMSKDFQFPDSETEIWKPMGFTSEDISENNRGSHYLNLIARMKPGVGIEQAQADVSSIARQMQQDHPKQYEEDSGWGASVVSLKEEMVGDVRVLLIALLVAVGFVLLIACVNIANLLLVRASSRQKEIAVRLAFGAGRWRIIRQLLIESLMMSLIGGTFGVLVAFWGTDLLMSLSPESLPRVNNIQIDARVIAFTFAISLFTGLIFGIIPALQALKFNLNDSLKESGGKISEGKSRHRLRGLLVAAEIALALVLLIGAGLMIKSLYRLQQVDLGFNPTNVLSLRLSLPQTKYPDSQKQRAFFDQLIEKTKTLPDVKSVGVVNFLPLSDTGNQRTISVEGKPENPINAQFRMSNPDYFRTMGIELKEGRLFDKQDNENSTYVAIVNETFVRIFFQGESPINKRMKWGKPDSRFRWLNIVGVVKDVKHSGQASESKPEMYFPYSQPPLPNWNVQSVFLAVRTNNEPQSLISHLRGVVREIDKDQPIYSINTMQQLLKKSTASHRFNMTLMGIFSALALLLAAIGIYGVMSFAVTQRTREIGIRVALGAQASDVMKMVIRQGMIFALIGVGAGIAVSFALMRLIEKLLFNVSTTDTTTFILVSLFLTFVALLACFIPARRAAKVDPMIALRYE